VHQGQAVEVHRVTLAQVVDETVIGVLQATRAVIGMPK
jgi:hypothetical protein